MIDLRDRTGGEPSSSANLRNAIVSRHDELRGLLAETVELADPKPKADEEVDALRARARRLYCAFEEHLAFEEQAFPQALSDVIGVSAVLRQEIDEERSRERHTLAEAFSALEPEALSWRELAEAVRASAAALLDDIEREEAALLNADLDEIANDSEGG